MTTEERLQALEDRVSAVETIVTYAQGKLDAFATGPGRKILQAMGVKL